MYISQTNGSWHIVAQRTFERRTYRNSGSFPVYLLSSLKGTKTFLSFSGRRRSPTSLRQSSESLEGGVVSFSSKIQCPLPTPSVTLILSPRERQEVRRTTAQREAIARHRFIHQRFGSARSVGNISLWRRASAHSPKYLPRAAPFTRSTPCHLMHQENFQGIG